MARLFSGIAPALRGGAIEVLALAGLLLVGCVDSQAEDPMGKVSFVGGQPLASPDYMAPLINGGAGEGSSALGGPGAAPIAGTASAPIAGTGALAGGAAPPMNTGPAGAGGPGGTGAGGTGASMTAGTGGAGAAGMGGGSGTSEAGTAAEPMPTGNPGSLKVMVTSVAVGGRYAPRNAGAIWIETSSGQFVKTIERWAGIRAGDLRRWNQASGGWGFSFFGPSNSPDAVDAVSGATLTRHQTHSPTWAGKDVDGMVMPDGQYKVVLEVADGTAAVSEVMFTKGPMAQTANAAGGGRGYSAFTVTYTP